VADFDVVYRVVSAPTNWDDVIEVNASCLNVPAADVAPESVSREDVGIVDSANGISSNLLVPLSLRGQTAKSFPFEIAAPPIPEIRGLKVSSRFPIRLVLLWVSLVVAP